MTFVMERQNGMERDEMESYVRIYISLPISLT